MEGGAPPASTAAERGVSEGGVGGRESVSQ